MSMRRKRVSGTPDAQIPTPLGVEALADEEGHDGGDAVAFTAALGRFVRPLKVDHPLFFSEAGGRAAIFPGDHARVHRSGAGAVGP